MAGRDDATWSCRYKCATNYIPNLKNVSTGVLTSYAAYKANPCVPCPDYVCPAGQYRANTANVCQVPAAVPKTSAVACSWS